MTTFYKILISLICSLPILIVLTGCSQKSPETPFINDQANSLTTQLPKSEVQQFNPTPSSTLATVNIYLIAGGDQGRQGKATGCGDSVVPIPLEMPAGKEPARVAFEALLSLRDPLIGNMNLYNPLHKSSLKFESLETISQGSVILHLTGKLDITGLCDKKRVQGIFEEMLTQFPDYQTTQILINNQSLAELLDLSDTEVQAAP